MRWLIYLTQMPRAFHSRCYRQHYLQSSNVKDCTTTSVSGYMMTWIVCTSEVIANDVFEHLCSVQRDYSTQQETTIEDCSWGMISWQHRSAVDEADYPDQFAHFLLLASTTILLVACYCFPKSYGIITTNCLPKLIDLSDIIVYVVKNKTSLYDGTHTLERKQPRILRDGVRSRPMTHILIILLLRFSSKHHLLSHILLRVRS